MPDKNQIDTDQNTSRRSFLQKLTALGTAGVITPVVLSACGGGGDEAASGDAATGGETSEAGFSCMDTSGLTDAQIQQRESTNYVDESPNPDQLCSNCQLYTQPEAGAQCGGCQVVPGPIHPDGYCDLWVAAQA
ncbi:MAG: high-potential iron-sulfur protein [Rhodothermales bacterium]